MSRAWEEDEPAVPETAGCVRYVPISTLSEEEQVKAWGFDCCDLRSGVRGGTVVPEECRDTLCDWLIDGYDWGTNKSAGEAEQLRM